VKGIGMQSEEYRAICARLGLSAEAFARCMGVRSRPSWVRGSDDGPVPPAVATLARIAEAASHKLPSRELATLLRQEAARLDDLPPR
jgi:transcriptional regulator with XRE-family HTH domain